MFQKSLINPWWYVLNSKNILEFRGLREAERGEEGAERRNEREGRRRVSSGQLAGPSLSLSPKEQAWLPLLRRALLHRSLLIPALHLPRGAGHLLWSPWRVSTNRAGGIAEPSGRDPRPYSPPHLLLPPALKEVLLESVTRLKRQGLRGRA